MIAGHFIYGLYGMLFGLSLAVVIMFWGFSGKFEQIIEKHTGLYDLDNGKKDKQSKPQRRKW